MKKSLAVLTVIGLMISSLLIVPIKANPVSFTKHYEDVTLSGGSISGNFPEVWDLTVCDLVIAFTIDLTGMVDNLGCGAHAWTEFGVRDTSTIRNFNPGDWTFGGKGVWLVTDYDWAANTFDPDIPGSQIQDLDDKLILQKGGSADERCYDMPSIPQNPLASYGVWFDRDGVDQDQSLMWGAVDGVTYNTGGRYRVEITLHATNDFEGTAYMTVNGIKQGFYNAEQQAGQPDLYPAGITFSSGDLKHMHVFYGLYGYGALHTVRFEDVTVTGADKTPVTAIILEGTEGKGDWFRSDVIATLTTTGEQSDVHKIEYSFNGINWITCTRPFTVSTEGTTTVFYRSTYNTGNVEPTKTKIINIDKAAPEGTVMFDLGSKDIAVVGVDNIDPAVDVILLSTELIRDHEELRTYLLSDVAGNTLRLQIKVKKAGSEIKAELVQSVYTDINGRETYSFQENCLKIQCSVNKKTGSVKTLAQRLQISTQLTAQTEYKRPKGQTKIEIRFNEQRAEEYTIEEMWMLNAKTSRGTIGYVPPI